MIELERTFLAKHLPDGLTTNPSKELIDIYIPKTSEHPVLRIRKNGDKMEMTKKEPVKDDPSKQREQTIILTSAEFDTLRKLDGKVVRKLRYKYPCKGRIAEVDVFQDALHGLVLVDFDSEFEKDNFKMPDFCLVDITQEKFVAGGMICGKSYQDIESDLNRFDYSKII